MGDAYKNLTVLKKADAEENLKQKLIERGMNLALGCTYAVIVHESFFL
jgi:hypothetical protein